LIFKRSWFFAAVGQTNKFLQFKGDRLLANVLEL